MKLIPSLALAFAFCLHPLLAGQNSLKGSIWDAQGLPLAGATVYLAAADGTQVTVSDLQGGYAFQGLADGAYRLQAWAGARQSVEAPVSLASGAAQSQDAVVAEAPETLTLALKLSQIKGGQAAPLSLNLQVEAGDVAGELAACLPLEGALEGLQSGEYEIVAAWPGAAYVGTCSIFPSAGEQGNTLRVVHTSGMEIAGADYIQALSEQALANVAPSGRL
jgi:hypothetical protein